MVMLEHSYIVQNEAVRKQLNNQLELIEDFLERLGSVVDQFAHHPLLKIDARLIHDGLAH